MSRAQTTTPLEEASDPKTSEKRLAALASEHASDLELLAAIARHGNTSTKTLLEVAASVPTVAVRHPAFGLMSMGGGASFVKFPAASVMAILAHGAAPPELVHWVETARARYGTPDFDRVDLYRATLRVARGDSLRHQVTVLRPIAQALSRSAPIQFAKRDMLEAAFLAYYRHASGAELEKVLAATNGAYTTHEAVALLEGLATHPRAARAHLEGVIERLLSNKHTSGNRYASGSTGRFFETVEASAAVAEKLFSRAELAAETVRHWCDPPSSTAQGRDAVVRGAIRAALRRGLLPDAERKALLERELTARIALASFDELTAEELAVLATDQDYRVRARIAAREDATAEQLAALGADDILGVAEAAVRNPASAGDVIRAALSHPRRGVRRIAAEVASPALLEEHAEPLSKDPDGLTRLAIATRRDAPLTLLDALARDKSPTVRRAVAKNGSTPAAALDLLAKDENPRVLDGLKKRPKPKA